MDNFYKNRPEKNHKQLTNKKLNTINNLGQSYKIILDVFIGFMGIKSDVATNFDLSLLMS